MMLPDSKIVEKCCLGSTKLAYLITHRLASYFHDELLKLIPTKCYMFRWNFNEMPISIFKAFNDIVIRFWDSSMSKVCSQYLPSSFMGHSTAEDIMNNFLEASSEMKLCSLVQVSLDGPSVNWSFLEHYHLIYMMSMAPQYFFLVLVVYILLMVLGLDYWSQSSKLDGSGLTKITFYTF